MFGKKKTQGIGGSLISGLDISQGSFVQVNATPEALNIVGIANAQKKEYTLAFGKIKSIRLMNETEIREVIEQSVPGMVLGAAAFGIIGAMIGGRIHTKEKKTLKQILVIDYGNQIVLDCSGESITNQKAFVNFVKPYLPAEASNAPAIL